jgi:hypothetical protein
MLDDEQSLATTSVATIFRAQQLSSFPRWLCRRPNQNESVVPERENGDNSRYAFLDIP